MKKRYIVLFGAGFVALGGLATLAHFVTPVVKYILLDEDIEARYAEMTKDEKMQAAADVLQRKCAACHSEDAKPIAILDTLSGGLMTKDILGAHRSYLMTSDADIRHKNIDLVKMDYVIRTESMPPPQYIIMHWETLLSDTDKRLLREIYPEDEAKALVFQAIDAPKALTEEEKEKAYFGNLLFHDKRLSSDNTVACASCHDLTKGGTDNLEKSEGVFKDGKAQLGGVNAPTVYNALGHIKQFWDGRAADLKAQAGGPPLNPVEMGYAVDADWDLIAAKLKEDPELVSLFEKFYPNQGITADTITDAIAFFEKTLTTPDSPFDCYIKGDAKAMTAEQKAGMQAFADAKCATCHSGASLGGQSFEYVNTYAAIRDFLPKAGEDAAFGLNDFTKKEEHKDMFRVPTLRNVALTQPYFHTGTVNDLEEAVHIMFKTQCNTPYTDAMIANVTAFLKAQTGQYKGKSLDQLTVGDTAPSKP